MRAHRRWTPCFLLLLAGAGATLAQPDDARERLLVLLEETDGSDLEEVMRALGRASRPLALDAAALAAALEERDCSAPSPLLAGAERLEVRLPGPGKAEARVRRKEAVRAASPWGGQPMRSLELERVVGWRVLSSRLVSVRGVRDLGPAPAPEAPLPLPADDDATFGFVELVRRGGPSAEWLEPPPDPPVLAAVFEKTSKAGQRSQQKTGRIGIDGRWYTFRSGGFGSGNLPPGEYGATAHRWERSEPGYTVGGVGWTVALTDAWDPRVGKTRTHLRIHPDGNKPGTEGCIGIVGDRETMIAAREGLRAELARGGGRFVLRVRE